MNPFIDKTYAEALAYLVDKFGDLTALVFEDERYSFRDLQRQADIASARLDALGIEPGQTIGLWLTNRPEFAWLWLGAAQMGAIPVVLNTRLRPAEFEYQIRQSDSVAVFVPGPGAFRDFLGDLTGVCPAVREGGLPAEPFPKLKQVISLDPPGAGWENVIDWSALPDDGPVPPYCEDPEAPAIIAYSSGTTSLPKGVMLSPSVWRKAYDVSTYLDLTPEDCQYLSVPLFGVFGFLNGLQVFWSRGCRIILRERFDAGDFIATAQRENVTFAQLLPTMVDRIEQHPNYSKEALKSLRGGTLLSSKAADLKRTVTVLGAPGYAPAYGLTESTGPVTRCRWDDPLEVRLAHHGWPMPGYEIRVVDVETGEDLPPGTEGEILIGGYGVMIGYYNKPKETAKAIDKDGWLHTGDLGHLNEDGSLNFLRRVKDGYKHKGFNVSTPEVEAAIMKFDGVREAAVVGVPDPEFGECGVAFVVPRANGVEAPDSLPAQVQDFLRDELSSFKRPKAIFLLDELPRTAGTGKVQSGLLREMAAERLSADS